MIKVKNSKDQLAVLLSTLFISISLFVYQVILTRIYSALLWYHYVFLITSFAILGLGIGSIIAYKYFALSYNDQTEYYSESFLVTILSRVTLLLSLCFIFVLGLIYLMPNLNNLIVYVFLGTLPFVLGGYYYSNLFKAFSNISSKIYFADLIGSAIGSILVILLLNYIGLLKTVFVLCIFSLIPSILLSRLQGKRLTRIWVLFIVFVIPLFLPANYAKNIEKNFNGFITNSNKTLGNIKDNGGTAKIVYSDWNAFSRTDVIEIDELPEKKIITMDGAANAPMYSFDGNLENLGKYKTDIEYLPFSIGANDSTLIIGPGGGRDLLYALAGGSKDVTAVEINKASIDASIYFKDYNGNIYNRPEVKVYTEDGRNYVRKTKDKYDNIYLSLVMTNASQGAGYALSEDFIYTIEAIDDYLALLKQNGKLSFIGHGQDDVGKIIATVITSLSKKGIAIEDTPRHISIFMEDRATNSHGIDSMQNPTVIVKNTPFTREESEALVKTASENGNSTVFAPFVYENGPLSYIKQGQLSMIEYINGFKTNVTPATDDRPYFYNFHKGISPVLLLILSSLIFVSAFLFKSFVSKKGNVKPSIYFGLLGIGFMLVEIPLIQRFILYLGHPTLAFTYILAALLLGSGVGGFFSSKRLFTKVIKEIYIAPIMVVLISIILLTILPIIFSSTASWNLSYKIVLSIILVMLQGFFMGMPFPRGITILGKNNKTEIIPAMWGINGVMSVIGSVLSVIVSMQLGFSGALAVGALIYLFVSFIDNL